MLALVIASCILSVVILILLVVFRPKSRPNAELSSRIEEISRKLDQLSANIKEDFRMNREENVLLSTQNRRELNESVQQFRQEMTETLRMITEQNRAGLEGITRTLDEKITALTSRVETNNRESREAITNDWKEFSLVQRNKFDEWKMIQKEGIKNTLEQLEKISVRVEEKLTAVNEQAKNDNHLVRQSLDTSFKNFREGFQQGVESINNLQREKFGQMEERQTKLVEATEKKLEGIRETVEEKLQKTLHERLGHSFEMVRGQLESVQKGLGEMQTLAQDVGGLKRVLSNVKMRGGFGEVQLHMLLENILAPEQYEANVVTKKDSGERVEFAVKFPNKEGERSYVWLPIDAKFPKDAYEHLQAAYDLGDPAAVESAQKVLETVIKKMAKDICEKYIDAPDTTNFGIMFLPFEGLFAEVVRKASLLEEIQRDCKVIITGPTTLAVILNSLQMGFRTLAIQKRSSEVWQVLGAVKKEFNLFGSLLEKAQNNIQTGLNQLDNVVGVRTRAIQRKLKDVEVMGDDDPQDILQENPGELLED